MRRVAAHISVLVCVCLLPAAALARPSQRTATGKITYLGSSVMSIQSGGRPVGVINALIAAANALSARHWPYVWGGGHGEAGVASIGERGGPGYNGRRVGYDCSGAIAAVLSAAGLWAPGSSVPNDAGVIQELLARHLIAPGAGVAPDEVTLYDEPGVHIFMNINGHFFGTSDGGGGDPSGTPTWIYDGAPDAVNHTFRRYHFLPSVLNTKTSYGQSYTFQTDDPSLAYGAELGDKVTITYGEARSGSMSASALQYAGVVTVSGTVAAIGTDEASLTITTTSGTTLTLSTSAVTNLLAGLAVGDGVQVTYAKDPSHLLIPHSIEITSVPTTTPTPAPLPTLPGLGALHRGGRGAMDLRSRVRTRSR